MSKQVIAFALFAGLIPGADSLADTKMNDGTVLSDTPAWIVTYIEVAANMADEAEALIIAQTAKSRNEKGHLRFEALQRLGRDNHFVILEVWSDPEARAAHAVATHTRSFREALQPMLYAPYDERQHVGLAATPPDQIPAGDDSTVYVLTHADIIPPQQFVPCNRQPDPQGPCGNDLLTNLAKAGREHEGNLRFDVLTQSNRANHMTVIEMWSDAAAQDAHQLHPDKKRFRDELSTMLGSLWDERLYRLID